VTDTQEKYEYFLAFANELTKDCTTDAERINVIFEWLNTNIEYDMGAVYDDMYDALINKRGVCAHYSSLMVQMLRCLNIPSMIVNGYLWDGIQFPIPSSIKWMDDHYVEVTGNHSWLIAYDGESWKTYDPTNDYIFKDYDPNYFYHLFPTSVEGLQVVGEGSYTRSYLDTVPLFIEDGVWYRRTYYGYDVTVNDFWYDYYAINSHYNQATETYLYYRLVYGKDGTLETGLVRSSVHTEGNTVTTTYCYVLDNGRVLANVTLTLDGTEYCFDKNGECTVTARSK